MVERVRFLLVGEAAEILRVDESTLYRHLRAGRFPSALRLSSPVNTR